MINFLGWLWPADRLGCAPFDPRYFTHVGRAEFITGGWARPTTTPSHRCSVAICQRTRIGVDGKADVLWPTERAARAGTSYLAYFAKPAKLPEHCSEITSVSIGSGSCRTLARECR